VTDPADGALALAQELVTADGQLATRMGISFLEVRPGRLVATMPVEGNRQPYGLLHGGASAVLAETMGSIAAQLHAGPDRMAIGVDLNCTHLRAARDGLVTGVCTPLHEGRRVATYQIEITDADGRPTCVARLTCQLIARGTLRAPAVEQPA
jgi:1,4-dihydroxy-2-naphthoyl-CoA hydrolase